MTRKKMKYLIYLVVTLSTIKNSSSLGFATNSSVLTTTRPTVTSSPITKPQLLRQMFSNLSNKSILINLSSYLNSKVAVNANPINTPQLFRLYDLTLGTPVNLNELLAVLNNQICQANSLPVTSRPPITGNLAHNLNGNITGVPNSTNNSAAAIATNINNQNDNNIKTNNLTKTNTMSNTSTQSNTDNHIFSNANNSANTNNNNNGSVNGSSGTTNGVAVTNIVTINHTAPGGNESSTPVTSATISGTTSTGSYSDTYEYNVVNGYLVVKLNGQVIRVMDIPTDNSNTNTFTTTTNDTSHTSKSSSNTTVNNNTSGPTSPFVSSAPPNMTLIGTALNKTPVVATPNDILKPVGNTNDASHSSSVLVNTQQSNDRAVNDGTHPSQPLALNPNNSNISNNNERVGGPLQEFPGAIQYTSN